MKADFVGFLQSPNPSKEFSNKNMHNHQNSIQISIKLGVRFVVITIFMDITRLQSSLPTLEKYALATDRNQYFQKLPQGFDKELLNFFRNPFNTSDQERLREIGIPQSVIMSVQEKKMNDQIGNAQKIQDIEKLLGNMKKIIDHSIFEQPHQEQNIFGNAAKKIEQHLPDKIETENDFEFFIKNKLTQEIVASPKRILSNVSYYALKRYFMKYPKQKNQLLNLLSVEEKMRLVTHQDFLKFVLSSQEKILFLSLLYTGIQEAYQKRGYLPHPGNSTQNYFSDNIYTALTTTELNLLGEKIPDLYSNQIYCRYWFRSNYSLRFPILSKNNELLDISQKHEKKKILNSTLEDLALQKQKCIFESFPLKNLEVQCLTKLMFLDMSLYDPRPQTLVKYLNCYPERLDLHNKDFIRLIESEKNSGKRMPAQNIVGPEFSNIINRGNISKLLLDYLGKLFEMQNEEKGIQIDHNKLLKFFQYKIYFTTKARHYLKKGKSIEDFKNVLNKEELFSLKNERSLRIQQANNCKYLGVKDNLQLKLQVKNIDMITVKVYEIDLEKYYLQKNEEVTDSLNLQSLTPSDTFQREIQIQSEYQMRKYNLPITLKEQRGLYIIEIEGKGQSSRAIIRKGAIVPIKKLTLLGLQIQFYYEDSQKLVDKGTLWINKRKFLVKDGKCTIPYGKNAEHHRAVVVSEGFSHIFTVQIPQEKYSLKVVPLFNEENFIVGNKAKIILHPRLYLVTDDGNLDDMVSLKLLKQANIQVQLMDSLGINSSLRYKDIEFKSDEDFVIDVPIQSYTKHLSVRGTAQIEKYNGQKENLSFEKSINIGMANNANKRIGKAYLRKQEEGFSLNILGLNGEPLANVDTRITAFYSYCQFQEDFTASSNGNGQIFLGPLKFIRKIAVNPMKSQSEKSFDPEVWFFDDQSSEFDTTNLYTFKEGEKVQLPLPQSYFKVDEPEKFGITFHQVIDGLCLQELSHLIQIKNKYLTIENLKEGKYQIKIFSIKYQIDVAVIKGKEFEKPNQVYCEQKQKIYELLRNSNEYLRLGEAKISEKGGVNDVEVQILKPVEVNFQKSMKAHIFVSNFIPNKLYTPIVKRRKDIKVHKFERKGNSYLSNKKLSEETAYILNRRNQKQFIGNNFEKPHILLKRIKVRSTNEIEEQMNADSQYQKVQYNNPSAPLQQQGLEPDSEEFEWMEGENYSSHCNFLRHSGKIIANIKDSGTIKFQIPKFYGYFSIFLISNTSLVKQNYFVSSCQIEKKSVAHIGLPKEKQNKAISISRQIYPLSENDKEPITIDRNSKWSAISLHNIKIFAESKGIKLDSWIDKWSGLSKQSKLKLYNKKMCHELNCFIKHHDIVFFNEVVGPYLRNKINKSVVDLCLLEDQGCLYWTTIEVFMKLNVFEQILLIEYLAKRDQYAEAALLSNRIILKEKTKKVSFNSYKRQFDTMLNSNLANQNELDSFMPPPPPPPPPPGACFGYMGNNNNNYDNYDNFNNYNQAQNQTTFNSLFGQVQQAMPMMQQQKQPMPMMRQNVQLNSRSMVMNQSMMNQAPSGFGNSNSINMMNQAPPPPPGMAPPMPPMNDLFFDNNEKIDLDEEPVQMREKLKKEFKQIEKTEEYDEVSYQGVKQNIQGMNVQIPESKFWAQLAAFLIEPSNNNCFQSESILYLTSKLQFQLACCFIPNNLNSDYEMEIQGNNLKIHAKNPFLVFLKEIKQMDYISKFGITLNHRFYDPYDQFIYTEDGLKEEKCVPNDEFKPLKIYSIQTIITNTSGNSLELQILLDIPAGSVPLQTTEYTQITNISISSYSTKSFVRNFYFPAEGEYQFYPANVSWGRNVIAKANYDGKLIVSNKSIVKELKSFSDVLNSGKQSDVLAYMQEKNIYDPQLFNPSKILWMFKNKQFYEKAIKIFKEKMYFNEAIWRYSILHNDFPRIKQYFKSKLQIQFHYNQFRLLEYYPYFSTRSHRYLDESKSKIRNVELKQTYYKFIIDSIITGDKKRNAFRLGALYYLLLQDRIDEASQLIKQVTEEQRKEHSLQFDYFECFIDMYEGYPSFSKARKIVEKYKDFPIAQWKKNMNEIGETLKEYDSAPVFEEEITKVEYKTQVYRENKQIRFSIPPETQIQILIFPIDIELYFSELPFKRQGSFISIKPSKKIVFEAGKPREQTVQYDSAFKSVMVEIYETTQKLTPKKISSFEWTNPKLKVKINESKGTLQVFYEGKQIQGSYCKVYSLGSKGQRFYRDGYTDITGTFKYTLSGLQQINKFSILCMNQYGGIISVVSPPKEISFFEDP